MQFTFSQQTIDKVKTNYLITQPEFKDCVTDSDYCLTFFRVSQRLGVETGLAQEIAQVVISYYSNTVLNVNNK